MTKHYEPHPFADIFPLLEGDAFDALEKDIEARGQQEPIWVYEGKILDGRNRYRACQRLARDPLVQEYTGNDAMGFVLSANLHRRHLNEGQRAMVGANLTNLVVGANQHTKGGLSPSAAAALLKVGTASINRAKAILKSGNAELIKDVTEGNLSIAAGADAVREQSNQPAPEPGTGNGGGEPPKPPKQPRTKSDTVKGLAKSLVDTLKEWKKEDEGSAITATSDLVRQLEIADLIEEKEKKAA